MYNLIGMKKLINRSRKE